MPPAVLAGEQLADEISRRLAELALPNTASAESLGAGAAADLVARVLAMANVVEAVSDASRMLCRLVGMAADEASPVVPVDHDRAADVVARMLDTAERARADLASGRVGALALLVADAQILTKRLADGWSRDDLAQIAGRLWMVGAS